MDADKAIYRIQSLLKRTEDNGASPAEEDTAARMVCKLLRQFPRLLGQTEQHSPRPPNRNHQQTRSTNPDYEMIPIRYQAVSRQTDKAILVTIKGNDHWLPLRLITIKTGVILMPKWLARLKKLI